MEFRKRCSLLTDTTALQLHAVHTTFSHPITPHNFQQIMPWPVLATSGIKSQNKATARGLRDLKSPPAF